MEPVANAAATVRRTSYMLSVAMTLSCDVHPRPAAAEIAWVGSRTFERTERALTEYAPRRRLKLACRDMSAIYLYMCLDARVVPALLGATAVSPKAFLVGPNVGFIRGIAQSCEYQVVSPQCGPVRENPPRVPRGQGPPLHHMPQGGMCLRACFMQRVVGSQCPSQNDKAGHVPIDDPVPGSPRVALGKALPRIAGCLARPPFRAAGSDGTALPRAASRLAT